MRPTPLQQRFTPAPLALAAALAIALSAGYAPRVNAQSSTAPLVANPIAINIPAQPLGQALNELARQANLQMTFPAALVAGRQAPAVSGQLTPNQALERLLAGSGLTAQTQGTLVMVRETSVSRVADSTLPAVTVTASTDSLTARGSRQGNEFVSPVVQVGILGDRAALDTPFSIQSYTRDVIEAQQARTLADVLKNDAGAKNMLNAGGYASGMAIRGFETFSATWDGLLGPAYNYQDFPLELVDGVEVVKGPGALLFGGGNLSSPAGSVNLVPKRAPTSGDIRRLSIGTQTGGASNIHADLGGRFGRDNAVGYRINAYAREGGLALDNVSISEKTLLASFDWRATRELKLTADLGHVKSAKNGYTDVFGLASGIGIPDTPSGTVNVAMPWAKWTADRDFALIKAEWQFAPDWMLTLSGTKSKMDFSYVSAGYIFIQDAAGNGSLSTSAYPFPNEKSAYSAKASGQFNALGVKHRITLNAMKDREYNLATEYRDFGTYTSNIYNPVYVSKPETSTLISLYPASSVDVRTLQAIDMVELNPQWTAMFGVARVDLKSSDTYYNAGFDTGATTPLAGLLYKPDTLTSIYASYAEGLEFGGTAPASAANAGQKMNPRITNQTELGVKRDIGSIQLAAALFRIDRALEYTDAASNRYVQNGLQRHTGLELSASGQVTPNLHVVASTMLLSPTVNNGDTAVNGNRATGVPERSVSLYANYRLPMYRALAISAGMQYKSAQWFDLANTQRIDAWAVFDLGATLDLKEVFDVPGRIRLNIDNVADKAYWSSVSYGCCLARGEPRTVKLNASFDF